MAKKIDLYLVIIILIISFLGLLTFFSASYYYSLVNFQNPYFYFQRFFIRTTLLGIIVFFVGNFLGKNLIKYKKIFIFLFFVSYLTIFLGFLPLFKTQEVARWVNLGFISFQPSEIIKPFSLLFFIFLINGLKKFSLNQKIILFIIFFFFLIIPIFLQPSYSNMIIIGIPLIAVFLRSLKSKKEIFISLIVFIVIFFILTFIAAYFWQYRLERIMSFLTQGKLFNEKYFQVEQAISAVSSGGLFGKGLGKSEIKILGLPQMLTDSIFAIYAEEFGFLGSVFLLLLFFLLILRIIILGKNSGIFEKEAFSIGVSVWFLLQIFLHISSNIGLFIPTGVILPFFSYGSSGQLAIYFSLGVINSFKK